MSRLLCTKLASSDKPKPPRDGYEEARQRGWQKPYRSYLQIEACHIWRAVVVRRNHAAEPIFSAVRMTRHRWPVKPFISFNGHHGDDFTQAITSGLFAAVRARQLAERSVG